MSCITIRAACTADIPTLLEFEQGVVAAERSMALNIKEGHVTYYDLASLIENPLVELAVAEHDEQLVACGYVRIDQSEPHNVSDQHGYLGFMYVLPSHRGQGINKQVLNYLFDWGRARGLSVFQLEVYTDNEAAINAYQKAGFQPNLLEMVLVVS
jgi:ribosomal protein S18 acetylase RimI-like enzyme